jgi:glycosyltransferase involved in cell wall biosynthesis
VSRGDDRLVQLGDRRGWHFPRAEGGGYAGHYPADGAAAVEHLEALRAEGAGYLVLPATASWWLEHYPELRRRLEEPGRAVHRDDDCTVYALGDQAPEPARSAAAPVAREAGPEPADGDAAIRLLDELHAAGAEYVLVPRAALDWLEQYPGLRQRLEGADHATAHRTGAGTVFALGPAASPPVAGRPGEPPRATGQGAVVRRSSGPRAAGQREVLVLGTGRAGRGAEELAERLASKGRYAVEQRWVALAEGAAKFEAVNELLVGEDLGRYEYVVVADGELDVPDGFLDDFLGLQEELGFALAQPAYDIESSPTHPMVGRQLGVVARETRLVIPEPLVSIHRSAFDLILPFDAEAPRGYGYENVWPLLLGRRGLRMGVIDATPVAWAPAPPPVTAVDERKAFLQRRGHLPFDVCSTVLDAYTRRDGALRALVEGRTVYLPLISAVVATYNRADLLEHALESLVDQTLAKELYEVVVVDDGSTDATAELCRTFMPRLNLRYMRIDHAGRSGAKNMGVFVARAPIVLLFDDDDAAERNLLEEHVEAHRQHADESVAILGYTTWAPSLAVTPVMEYATEIGQKLFAYRNLRDGQVLGFAHFWEGRLSCKRAFLLERGVHDQRLNYTIDIELGYRLSKHGLRVIYDRSAVSYMVRPITFDEMCRRSEGKGAAELRFSRLHPRDPAIQRYCHVGDAAGIWQDAAPLLEKRVRRVHALEERLARKVARAGAGKALEELRALYGWCFDAFRAKGIVEEIQRTAASPSATAPLPSARLSIVVPLWNVTVELAEMTARHLARVREVAQMDVQIVVVDNGSPHRVPTDADVTIEWSENRGIAAAWNAGADAASGDVLCFFNNDVWVEPGWDVALHQAAHDGRRIVFPYTDHGDGASVRPDTAGVAGWCFALSRAVWQEVGRFDESFGPAFFEDTDYFHRAWERGIDLNPVPVARVRHVRRTTASRQPHVEWLFQAHRLKYGWKHGVDPTKPPPFYLREIVDYGSAPAAAPG